MPLIILTGVPASGKTTRATELCDYFKARGKLVHIISEEEQILKAGFEKNSFYQDPSKEKHIRSLLKSEVLKLIGPKSLVILDGLNYIKGYRYELYCATKSNKCTQCTLLTQTNYETAWTNNDNRSKPVEKYTREVFDALLMRYEEPNANNRWDSPLFVAFAEAALDMKAISECLFDKKPPPPNQSTQNPPLSATNFLYVLDKVTKDITDRILKAKVKGTVGEIEIPGYENLSLDVSSVTTVQLLSLRRQYLTYSKMHKPEVGQIPHLYVQYLKSSLTS